MSVLSLWKGELQPPHMPPHLPTMREIAALVAERHGLTLDDLTGPVRKRRVAHPRQEAYSLIRATGRYSLPRMGMFFGNRDHTTILDGLRNHEARVEAARQEARAA